MVWIHSPSSRKEPKKAQVNGKTWNLTNRKRIHLRTLQKLLGRRKARIKSFLLDQKNVAGIGNVYIQDILFKSKLHPNRLVSLLSEKEVSDLYRAIKEVLNYSIQLGGLVYEKDFYGQNGKLTVEKFLVGYKTGKPCPTCKTPIEKIKTGSTSTYICPKCQKI